MRPNPRLSNSSGSSQQKRVTFTTYYTSFQELHQCTGNKNTCTIPLRTTKYNYVYIYVLYVTNEHIYMCSRNVTSWTINVLPYTILS